MEKNEIRPLFVELGKQLKVTGNLLGDIWKVSVNKIESSANRKVIKNPFTTLIVTSSLLIMLLLITNIGWFVKYRASVRNGDYVEMEVDKRIGQEKLRIEAEANELAFDRYQVKIDSLNQEIISLKGKKTYSNYKKDKASETNIGKKDEETIVKKLPQNEAPKSSNGDDFVEIKE